MTNLFRGFNVCSIDVILHFVLLQKFPTMSNVWLESLAGILGDRKLEICYEITHLFWEGNYRVNCPGSKSVRYLSAWQRGISQTPPLDQSVVSGPMGKVFVSTDRNFLFVSWFLLKIFLFLVFWILSIVLKQEVINLTVQ